MLDLYRRSYRGWNVKHFHEHLTRDHGFRWGYTWVKTELHAAGLVERADGQQSLPVDRVREAKRREQHEQVHLGDAELYVLPARRKFPLENRGDSLALEGVRHGLACEQAPSIDPAAEIGRLGGGKGETFEVAHSDAEWHELLTPDQCAVLRQSATERPFTSPLLPEKRRGDFACAGCDHDAFSSTTKFESRTGWPSFWAPLEGAVGTATDTSFGMVRTAVHCSKCAAAISRTDARRQA